MEYAVLWLFLTGGYVLAALLFWVAWKRRKPARITCAVIAGGLVMAQTLVWHGLIKFGEAWNGTAEGVWMIWAIPLAVHGSLTAVFLMRADDVQTSSLSSSEKPAPEEEYGPLR